MEHQPDEIEWRDARESQRQVPKQGGQVAMRRNRFRDLQQCLVVVGLSGNGQCLVHDGVSILNPPLDLNPSRESEMSAGARNGRAPLGGRGGRRCDGKRDTGVRE